MAAKNSDRLEDAIEEISQYYNILGKNDFFQYIIEQVSRDQANFIINPADASQDRPVPISETVSNKIANLLVNLTDGGIYTRDFLTHHLWSGFPSPSEATLSTDVWQTRAIIKDLLKIVCHEAMLGEDRSARSVRGTPDEGAPAGTGYAEIRDAGGEMNEYDTIQYNLLDYDRPFSEVFKRGSLDYASYYNNSNPSKSKTTLAAYQIYPSYMNLSQRDSGALQVFLNTIPPLEWSRCVPFLSAEIITPESRLDNIGRPRGISLIRFLNGRTETPADSVEMDMLKAQTTAVLEAQMEEDRQRQAFEASVIGSDLSGEDQRALLDSQGPRKEFSSAGMEVFTSPQTLVPAGELYKSYDSVAIPTEYSSTPGEDYGPPLPGTPGSGRIAPVADRMRPFMSLNSVKIKVQPTRGLMSTKSAKLTLTLHDRTRLGEIASLVKPDQLGHTEILLEYGWSHPDGESSSGVSNAYGKFLNSMRVKEKYSVYNTSYQFTDDGQCEIVLEMVTSGGISTNYTDIAMSPQTRATWMEIENIISAVSAARRELGEMEGFSDVTGMQTIATISPNNVGDMFNGETADEIRNFIASAGTSSSTSVADLGGLLATLEVKVREQQTTLNDEYQQKLRILKNGKDPFFYDNWGKWNLPTHSEYVQVSSVSQRNLGRGQLCSFGKLMMLFVGMPLAVSGTFDEVQLYFYCFNQRAGWMKGKNIGSFPIPLSMGGDAAFDTLFEEEIEKYVQWPIGRFVNWVKSTIFSNIAALGWGLSEAYEYNDEGRPSPRSSRGRAVAAPGTPNNSRASGYSGATHYEAFVQESALLNVVKAQLETVAVSGIAYDQEEPVYSGAGAVGAGDEVALDRTNLWRFLKNLATNSTPATDPADTTTSTEPAAESITASPAGSSLPESGVLEYLRTEDPGNFILLFDIINKWTGGEEAYWSGGLLAPRAGMTGGNYFSALPDYLDPEISSDIQTIVQILGYNMAGELVGSPTDLEAQPIAFRSVINDMYLRQFLNTSTTHRTRSDFYYSSRVMEGYEGDAGQRIVLADRDQWPVRSLTSYPPGAADITAVPLPVPPPVTPEGSRDVNPEDKRGELQNASAEEVGGEVVYSGDTAAGFSATGDLQTTATGDTLATSYMAQIGARDQNPWLFAIDHIGEGQFTEGWASANLPDLTWSWEIPQYSIGEDDFGESILSTSYVRQTFTHSSDSDLANTFKDLWITYFRQHRTVESRLTTAHVTHVRTSGRGSAGGVAARQHSLAFAYYGRAYQNGMDITFRMPSLKMVIEAVPRLPMGDNVGDTAGGEGTICRVHFVDEAAMKYPSLGMLLSEARNSEMGQLSANLGDTGSAENPDPAQYAQQVANTLQSLERQGIIARNEEYADSRPSPPRWRIVGGPPAIKNFIKRNMPSVVFGVQNSAIVSANAKTNNNSADTTIHLLRARRRSEDGDGSNPSDQDAGLAMRLMPFSLTLNMFGCPLLHHTQQIFIDFGTNTTVDNIFAVSGLEHKIDPGKFETSCKMIPIRDAYGVYRGLLETADSALSAISSTSAAATRAADEATSRAEQDRLETLESIEDLIARLEASGIDLKTLLQETSHEESVREVLLAADRRRR